MHLAAAPKPDLAACCSLLWRSGRQGLLDALSPRQCSSCDAPLARRAVFCATCAQTVLSAPQPYCGLHVGSALVAFGLYGGALAEALRRLKYEDRPELARPMGELGGLGRLAG